MSIAAVRTLLSRPLAPLAYIGRGAMIGNAERLITRHFYWSENFAPASYTALDAIRGAQPLYEHRDAIVAACGVSP